MSIPSIYSISSNPQLVAGLTPLQIALANQMVQYTKGPNSGLGINQEFMAEMSRFCNSNVVSTSVVGVNPGVVANTQAYFTVQGNVVSINRIAANCGPDENRRETVFVSYLTELPGALQTYLYYGPKVRSGPNAQGSHLEPYEIDWEGGIVLDGQGNPVLTGDGMPLTWGFMTEYGTAVAFMNAIQSAADRGSTEGSAATTENSST